MTRYLLVAFLCIVACNKKEAPQQKPEVLSLKEMSDLATVEYTVTKIIKANDNKTWFKVGDRKILMSCEATIKAGIDLSKLSKEDYSISDNAITIRLPQPHIVSLSIPPDKIKVEYQDIGVFRDPFKTQERDQLAAQAQAQINNSINELGILEQAKANTSLFVNRFLQQLGYTDVTITYAGTTNQMNVP